MREIRKKMTWSTEKHGPNPGFNEQKSQMTASTEGLEMSFQIRTRTQWGPKGMSVIRKE